MRTFQAEHPVLDPKPPSASPRKDVPAYRVGKGARMMSSGGIASPSKEAGGSHHPVAGAVPIRKKNQTAAAKLASALSSMAGWYYCIMKIIYVQLKHFNVKPLCCVPQKPHCKRFHLSIQRVQNKKLLYECMNCK